MTMGGGEIQATKDGLWLDGYEVLGLGKMKGSDWWGNQPDAKQWKGGSN